MTAVVVDVRFLAPPEPMERALEALDQLASPEDELQLLIHREPFPLYDVLRRHGYSRETETTPDGGYLIRIRLA